MNVSVYIIYEQCECCDGMFILSAHSTAAKAQDTEAYYKKITNSNGRTLLLTDVNTRKFDLNTIKQF